MTIVKKKQQALDHWQIGMHIYLQLQSNAFSRSSGRSRCITRRLVHVNKRDHEPSRIPMKKLVPSMSRNKTRRHKIKSFIR